MEKTGNRGVEARSASIVRVEDTLRRKKLHVSKPNQLRKESYKKTMKGKSPGMAE